MSGNNSGAIVHVTGASQSVDTTHLKDLAARLVAAGTFTGFAGGNITSALLAAPLELIDGFEHAADVTNDLVLLLRGTHSIGTLAADLIRLTKALTQSIALYLEAEQTAERQLATATPGMLSSLIPLKWRVGGILGTGALAFGGAKLGVVPQGSATQWGTRTIAELMDPTPLSGRYLTSEGPASAYELTPVQRAAIFLMRSIGVDRADGEIDLTELPPTAFDIGGADPNSIPPDFDAIVIGGRLPEKTVAGMGEALGYGPLSAGMLFTGFAALHFPSSNRGVSQYLGTGMHLLNKKGADRQEQVIRIDKITKPDGTVQHLVFIPGTTAGSDLFSKNPANHDANVNLVGGISADASRAVIEAMDAAGIKPGDNVALFGHSQGGIIAQNFAANEEFTEIYNVNLVVTVGAPTAGKIVDESIPVLHIEEVDDPIPGLDGAANRSRANQVTATFATSPLTDDSGWTHGMETYEKGLELVMNSANPELVGMSHTIKDTLGFHSGASVSSREFSAVRTISQPEMLDQIVDNALLGRAYDGTIGRVPILREIWPGPMPQPVINGASPSAQVGGR